VPDIADKFWKERLGVKLTPQEAAALTLATDSAGVSVHETASYLGILLSDAKAVCDALNQKAVVDERQGRIYIKQHLAELAVEAKARRKARTGQGRRKKQ
jgi:hypothetical protein